MEAIKTSSLSKYYGRTRGIEEISLSVPAGDFFGFIGPNGAGKSTLIRTLLGLISPTRGKAEIFGRDSAAARTEILARTGYMPSEAAFYSGMRVKDILSLSARLRKKDCGAEAARLCERLRLDPARRAEELSLGNRKKVSIICALQHEPELYILDEPTSGLDPLIQREFFMLLEERNRRGATVFLSSHVLSEIQRHCRRAAVIRAGRIIACGEVAALGEAQARRVTLHGVSDPPPLAGIRAPQRLPDGVSFLYGGDIPALLKELAQLAPRDLTIAEPDLEEIFLHYYTEGGGGA